MRYSIVVFKTAERRNNAAERLLQADLPILKQVCLATLADVTGDPFGQIWINPADYRAVTEKTQFDSERGSPKYAYRSQPERDAFIEAKIRKFSLLDP